jgi:hypothetical protein
LDRAAPRLQAISARGRLFKPRDGRLLEDPRAAHLGAGDEGHGGVHGIGLTVLGDVDRALDQRLVDRRVKRFGIGGADQLCFDAEAFGDGGRALGLVQPVLGAADTQCPVLLEARCLAGLGFEARIELRGCRAAA